MPAVKTKKPRVGAGVRHVLAALEPYRNVHPRATINVYRQSKFSIRVRVIDPDFAGQALSERDDPLWGLLSALPDDVKFDISMLLLLTPDEAGTSLANFDFENPMPSRI